MTDKKTKAQIKKLQKKYPNLKFLVVKEWPGLHLEEGQAGYMVHHVKSNKRTNFIAAEHFKADWFSPERLQYFNDNGTQEDFDESNE